MTGPLDRPADPLTTPAMTAADVDTLWTWVRQQLAAQGFELIIAQVLCTALREIDRARAAERLMRLRAESAEHIARMHGAPIGIPTTPTTKEH